MKATRTVYCYYFPEVRRIINDITKNYPHNVFLQSIEPGLDDFHIPIIEKFIKYHNKSLPNLKDFKHKYFTGGASEGIFHLLVKYRNEIIYVLDGEYEGYKEYAIRIGINIVEVDEICDFSKLKKGIFFISNPSARNGNIISNKFINEICKYHKVIYDITYVGLTKEHEFDLSNKNIIAIISSMSKPFGLYYYRIGFTFSREGIETLIANKWFKNIFSLIIASRIFDEIKHGQLYNKYRPVQEKIIQELNAKENLKLKISDVLLLAYSKENRVLEKFRRGKFYRICLTPYFLEQEDKNGI